MYSPTSPSYSPSLPAPSLVSPTPHPSLPPSDSDANLPPDEPKPLSIGSTWSIQDSGDPPVVRRQPGQRVDVSPIPVPRPESPYPRGAVFSGFGDEESDEEEVEALFDQPYVSAVSDSGMRLRIKKPEAASWSPTNVAVAPSPPHFQPLDGNSQDEPTSRGLSDIDTTSLTKAQLAALQRLTSVHERMTLPDGGELTARCGLKLLRDHELALARVNAELQAERRRASAHVKILDRSAGRRRIVAAVIRKCQPPAYLSQRFHVATDIPPQTPGLPHSS